MHVWEEERETRRKKGGKKEGGKREGRNDKQTERTGGKMVEQTCANG